MIALLRFLRRRPAAVLAASTLAGVAGCSNLHTLEVEASHRPETGIDLDARSYHVASITDTSTLDGGQLRRQEVAHIVTDALAVRGMYQAPGPAHADVLMEITYGMGPAKIEVTELTNPALGHRRTRVADEVREKHLQITARVPGKGEDGQPPEILWVVYVRSRDERDQLRKVIPILAEVAADWASRNTHGTRSFTATLENGVLVYVSGGFEQPGVAHLPP